MFWSEVDGALLRESAKLADPVRESIKAQVDIPQIIEQWNLSYPKGAQITKAEAKAWAKVHIKVDNNELNKGLGILYAIGWMFGRDVAVSAYAHARLNKAAPTDEQLNGLLNIDWSKWTPGNNPGALLASPPGGLKGLLQRRGLDLQGLTNTLLNRIGTHLADALMSGASDTMLGKMLETVVGDPERALTIANTSMASAMSVSTRETYQEFGVAKMRWLALEPCSTCSGNGAMGPITPGEALFKNVQGDNITEPPAHPNCRCALAPVIDLDQFKYVNQPRDEAGRWTSGAGGPAALVIPEGQRMASPANLVSATAPHVGLSPKAQAIAARISDVQHKPEIVKPDGTSVVEHTATYTAKNGTKADMVLTITTEGQKVDGQVLVNIDGEQVGGLLYSHVSGGYADLFSVPVSTIKYVTIDPKHQGLGIPTAALEFARSQSSDAILHSQQLTPEGREFAESTKYSQGQARDDRGRWTSGGGFVAGKWEKVDRAAQIDAAVEKYRTGTVNADGSPLSKEDVAAYRQSTETYYNKTDQYNNGNVIVTIPSGFDTEPGQTAKTADILKTVDELQTARPLTGKVELKMDNQYLMDLGGKSTLGFRQDLLSGEGSMIQINVAANERASGLMRQKKTIGTPMPSQTANNMLEFTMAHEWGHAWDAQANRSPSKSVGKILDKNPDLLGTISSYGKSSPNEAYAELFAQNYMEEKTKAPKMPVTAKTESYLK